MWGPLKAGLWKRQAADWEVVRHFPPLTLPQLRAQRKVLLNYSLLHPVRGTGALLLLPCWLHPPQH